METNARFITLTSTISTLNNEGTTDNFQANANYRITGGSLVIYDAEGAVLSSAVHDEITIDLRIDDTNLNPRNLTMSAFALTDILKRDLLPEITLESNKTLYMKAKHTTPANGANNAVPIKAALVLIATKY